MKTKTRALRGYQTVSFKITNAEIEAFKRVARRDGVTPAAGLAIMVRWAVAQNSLCPQIPAEIAVAYHLGLIACALNNARKQFDPEFRADQEGEEWKGGAA